MKYNYEKTPQGFCQAGSEYNINYVCLENLIAKLLTNRNDDYKINILEVGAGGGRNLLFLAQRFEGRVETFGTDISNNAMSFAKEQGVDHTTVSEASTIPYTQEFDLILLIDILEHLDSIEQVESTIATCMDHLNPSGILYISSPIELHRFSLTWWFSKLSVFSNLTRKYFGHTVQFNGEDLSKLTEKRGTVTKVFYSAHIVTQLQMLLFFYLPKVLIEILFGNKLSDSLRDSNQYNSTTVVPKISVLLFLKKLLSLVSRPMAAIGFWESRIMESNEFCAENIHIVIHK